MSIRNLMTGIFCGLTICAFAAETAPLVIPRITAAPKMDGSLTEDCWKNAAVLTNFTVVGKGVTTDSTECRLVMDDTWLYLGFRCKNPGMAQMDQKVTERDAGVSPDDSVEVFLDPGSDGALFFQFMLSFANVQADRMHTQKDGCNNAWDLPWRSATKVEKDGWTAEMAIPLFLIASYGDPAKVRLNVGRNERRIILDAYGAKMNEEKESSCWSPISKSYAEPDKFRPLTGFDGIKIGIPEMIALEGAEVGSYEMIGDKRGYTVKARLRSYTGKGGKAVIEARDCPLPDGKGEVVAQEVTVKPMQAEEFIIRVPVTSLQRRNTVVTLKEAGSGEVLRAITIKEAAVLNLMGEAVLDRNYYTTEKEARLRVKIGLPEAELKDKKLVVKLADGKVLVKSKIALQDINIAIPLKKAPLGEHALTVAVEDAKGAVVVEGKTILTKKVPKPGCEVKVDRFNRRLLKNGAPLFPFGLLKTDYSKEGLKQVAAAEHTGIMRWGWPGGMDDLTNMMAAAQALGLDVLDNTPGISVALCVSKESPTGMRDAGAFNTESKDAAHAKALMESLEKGLAKVRQPVADDIRAIRDFPNLIGYGNVDEPNLVNVARMVGARALYKWIHQDDGYRPVYTLFSNQDPGKGCAEVADVLVNDAYILPGWGGSGWPGSGSSHPNYMTVVMLKLKKRADSVNKPAMMVPMAEALDVARTPRALTADEQMCQTYLAVIHGAKGLFYFVDSSLYAQYMWDTLAELARQMKVIGPAAVSDEVYPAVRYAPVDMNAEKEVYPDVQATLFKNPAGGYLLLAANTALYPVDVKYTVPGIKASKGVQRLFKDGTFKVDGTGFKDKLEPYGVRAYTLELEAKAEKPVQLALELTAYPDQAMPFKIFNHQAEQFKNRKNRVGNPSFEETTIPGVPDYVRAQGYPRMGAPDAEFALDEANPVHGKYSLRETIQLPATWGGRISGLCYVPYTGKPVPVVFSAYVKASANIKQVYIAVGCMVSEESYHDNGMYKNGSCFKYVATTTEWRRVTFKGMVDPSRKEWYTLVEGEYCIGPGKVEGKTGKAEFWVDAVQLEIGDQATEFTTE